MHATCPCGAVHLEIRRPSPVRFFCHCTTCQEVWKAPFADITAHWSWKVSVTEGADQLRWVRLNTIPTSLARGLCRRCGTYVLGRLQVPAPGVTIVPSPRWARPEVLPDPVGHIFYHRRVADIDDDLQKVEGLWPSQVAAGRWMLPGLMRVHGPAV